MLTVESNNCILDGPDGDFSAVVRDVLLRIRATLPDVCRVAVASYDKYDDVLKTFAASTVNHDPLDFHQACLQDIPTLMAMAEKRTYRIVHDLRDYGDQNSTHTKTLVANGLLSSASLPIHQGDELLGFVFFNSGAVGAFAGYVESILPVYATLLSMAYQKYRQSVQILQGALATACSFARLRDDETSSHLARMSRYARLIAWGLRRKHGIDQEFVENIYQFSPLHDIGKVGVPDRILLKPGPLVGDELEIMRSHVAAGEDIINTMITDFGLQSLTGINVLHNIVCSHHERWDGRGYPLGLEGDGIPIEARIVAVADVFDALTSKRPYKDAWTVEDAFDLLQKESGYHFDPQCVDALIASKDAAIAIKEKYAA